ncbi:MAG: histidine kinase [Chitinophagaceae bacterium]
MKISFDKKRFRIYLWIGLAFLLVWLCGDIVRLGEIFAYRVLNNAWRITFLIFANFLLLEYTLQSFGRKRIFTFLLLIPVHIFLYSWGLYVWRLAGISLGIYTPSIIYPSPSSGALAMMTFSMMSLLFFTIARHIYSYIKLKQLDRQLHIERQEGELNYLRSQTNPHFLFNTLNNIYSLARDKSDLAPESIMRLSAILRFMLYETRNGHILIEQELEIIRDYLALERLRYDDSLRIDFNYHEVDDMKQALPCLLLIPLVENAFRNGVSETTGQPFIDIYLSVKLRQLMFIVKNSSETAPAEGSTDESTGLSNLRRQLELLYTNYALSVQQGQAEFTATLKINLASHVL